jgi:hypothetical protein
VKRVANLTGTWKRAADGVTFSLVDDGFRVIGEATGADEIYSYYEITLEWKDEKTLMGYGTLKESVDQCKFETSVAWSLEVADADHAKGMVEEVAWNDQCQEVDRGFLEAAFARQK